MNHCQRNKVVFLPCTLWCNKEKTMLWRKRRQTQTQDRQSRQNRWKQMQGQKLCRSWVCVWRTICFFSNVLFTAFCNHHGKRFFTCLFLESIKCWTFAFSVKLQNQLSWESPTRKTAYALAMPDSALHPCASRLYYLYDVTKPWL